METGALDTNPDSHRGQHFHVVAKIFARHIAEETLPPLSAKRSQPLGDPEPFLDPDILDGF